MTLIEVMIAMLIISMISTMIYGAFVQTRKNKERVQRITDRYHEIRMGLERVQVDLSMAYVSAHVPLDQSRQAWLTQFVGKDSGERDRVDFNTFGHRRLFRDAKESDQNEVSYFLADDPDDPGTKVLVRREDNRPDIRPDEGGDYQILVRNVEGFELEYLDPQTKLWTKSWDTTQAAGQPNRLPMQVKIMLTVPDVSDPSKERVFGTRATLPMQWGLNHAAYNP